MKKRKERIRITYLRRQILLRKSHCSDGVKGQAAIRQASFLDYKYIPDGDDPPSLSSCIFKSGHSLFDLWQPEGRT